MNLSPIKFQAIDILCGGDNAGARLVHNGGVVEVSVSGKNAFGLQSYMSYLRTGKRKSEYGSGRDLSISFVRWPAD
jgi:hypothetical protein